MIIKIFNRLSFCSFHKAIVRILPALQKEINPLPLTQSEYQNLQLVPKTYNIGSLLYTIISVVLAIFALP